MDRFNAYGYILTDRYDVTYLAGLIVAHRDLAHHPMLRRSVLRFGLLFDPLDPSRAKRPFKFFANFAFWITGQDIEHIASKRGVTRYSLRSDLPMTVPCHDPEIAIDHIERHGQRIQHCLSESPVLFTGASYRAIDRRF